MNQFAGVLTSATEGIAAAMHTQTTGQALVVYNPLNIEREDVVEASVSGSFRAVRVIGPDGLEVPAQVVGEKDAATRILFLARVPSVSYSVYDVQASQTEATRGTLKV